MICISRAKKGGGSLLQVKYFEKNLIKTKVQSNLIPRRRRRRYYINRVYSNLKLISLKMVYKIFFFYISLKENLLYDGINVNLFLLKSRERKVDNLKVKKI